MVNLASDVTFKVCLFMLEAGEFSQYEAKKRIGCGMAVVNSTFKYLEGKKIIIKRSGHYELVDKEGLCLAISYFRSMGDIILFSAETMFSKEELRELLPQGAVFCLESALEKYSAAFKSGNVFVYIDEKDLSSFKKKPLLPGKKSALFLYRKKPALGAVQVDAGNRCTDPLRTAVDLFCDNKAGLGAKLLEQCCKAKAKK